MTAPGDPVAEPLKRLCSTRILTPDQRSMKSQQRRGPDGNRDFQYALRRHEYRTQTQQDTVEGVERRCAVRLGLR